MICRTLCFISSVEEDYSLLIDYSAIGVHAVCHSTDVYEQPCIYCQVASEMDEGDPLHLDNYMSPAEEVSVACGSVEEIFFSPRDLSQRKYFLSFRS